MNRKLTLATITLVLALAVNGISLASGGAPTSQFGFSGWPYRQSTGCNTDKQSASCPSTDIATALPTPTPCPPQADCPAPTARPTRKPAATNTPEPTKAPEPTQAPVQTVCPTEKPTAAPSQLPVETASPTKTPAVTASPTAAPTATKKPESTEIPASTPVPPSTDDDYTTGSASTQEENAFLLLNADRAANGLSPLKLDAELCRLARMKSCDMNQNHYFAHTSPTFGSAADMLRTNGYSFTSVGENIAHHATVEKAQAAFMSSDGHRRNILGSQWTKVGVGVCLDSQGFVYVTQLFVR